MKNDILLTITGAMTVVFMYCFLFFDTFKYSIIPLLISGLWLGLFAFANRKRVVNS